MYIRRTLSLLAFGLLVYIVSVLFSGGRHNEHSHLQTFPRFYDFSVRDQTWPGWAGINHIFALYACCVVCWEWAIADAALVATRIQRRGSILMASNRMNKIPLAIQIGQAAPRIPA